MGDNFLNKINSKIGLNLSRGKLIKYYSSDKMFNTWVMVYYINTWKCSISRFFKKRWNSYL